MEEANHWTTLVKCNLCDEIPKTVPLYQCPLQHQYCIDCFLNLRKRYRGYIKNAATCVVCKTTGIFMQSKVNTDFLNKIKAKPGIGRPYRYNVNQIASNGFNYTRPVINEIPKGNVTIETLFRLPSEELKKLLGKKNNERIPTEYLTTRSPSHYQITLPQSKIPIKCPHKPCKKVIATSTFVSHFKHDHSEIPTHVIERNKELCIRLDVSIIEHNHHHCISMITVYDRNKIDIKKSQSTQSVIDTCDKFNQYVPINSFWLMVTGSPERKPNESSTIIWLFCPCDDLYRSTMEICSKSDSIAFSTYCAVHGTAHNLKFQDIANELHCLMISRASMAALLEEGPELNLRITVH